MSVSDAFLDAEFKYVSRISASPTPFAVYQTTVYESTSLHM